jgi:uncharacterized membrane protein
MKEFFVGLWFGWCFFSTLFGIVFVITYAYYFTKFMHIERHVKRMRQYDYENEDEEVIE